MNTWLLAVLAIIIGSHLFECLVSWLNLQALRTELPDEFSGVFSSGDYKKSQEYTKTTTRFAIITSSVSTITTLLFLVLGGFNIVDLFARSFGYGEIFTGLIFTGCLALLTFLLELPFRSYLIFVIEERFGFSRMTVQSYLQDILKSSLLVSFLGGPLLALIFWFFLRTGERAWVYCWLGVSIFSFILQYIAPAAIMPLFNTFSPLANESLKAKIMEYAEKQHFYIRDILTMDGSKRSSKLNAFFTGFGRFRKIVFFDTLLAKLSEEQLLAVLAHEIGHFRLKHIWLMLIASFIQTGIMFFILSLILNNRSIFDAFGMTHTSVYASLIFFAILFSPLNMIFSIIINHISRRHEFAADSFAVFTTATPEHLISALKILSRENLSNLTPHPLHVLLHSSHPPILERIEVIRRLQSS